ncbi:MAG TPA: metal-dependent hydrolase, partial [Candidatus Saccharimonadales bacterium]|nr:metal-dependent hydrolase [Candidatus Saccharimonadales bacterium]
IGVALFGFLAHALLGFLNPLMAHVNNGYVWWAFMIGMLSHLAMDTLTKEGVPWLLPIPIKFGIPPLRKFRITTGKLVETCLVFPLLLAFDIWLIHLHYPGIVGYTHHLLR